MSSTTNNGLKRKQESDASLVKLERPPEKIRCCVSNILDIPKEILIKIILLLNARERVGLGNSCKQFNSLVFEDEELLRNLDFSKDGHLTLASEVQQYFNNENGRDKIRKVNMRNTKCVKSGRMLNNSIGLASNLVDINIHGIEFKDIWEFGSFINPLPNVRRLSFDWSEARDCNPMCCKILQQPFSRLEYLSVELKVIDYLKVCIPLLRLCKELEQLCLVVKESSQTSYSDSWSAELKELKNLKVVEYCGPLATQIKERFETLLPNPENWVDFKLDCSPKPKGFHLCIVDICKELVDSKWIERVQNITPQNHSKLGWCLVPELLLKEVLQITCENVPEEFCCFSKFMDMERCLLKIDEAKRLMTNPESQISYLFVNHPIDLGCDVHLVISAFSNLTELVLAAITRNQESCPMDSHFQRRLIRRGNAVPEKQDAALNMDSSFKMIVENTPHLRHFTLGGCGSYKNWDLEELHLIPKWKFLQSLRLLDVPIEDGEFLIEIGKQCRNLQNLELMRLGPREKCCYENELLQMLTNSQNLRNFSIEAAYLSKISELFSSLINSKQLRRVCINTVLLSHQHSFESSIERLLHQCPKLTTFLGEFQFSNDVTYVWSRLSGELNSWIKERSRPHLQIKIRYRSTVEGTVFEDSPHFNPFPDMWMTI